MAHPSDARPNALVTGSGGFTGRYLRRELEAAGYRVFGISHRAVESEDEHAVDLRDIGALRETVERARPTLVAHLGAITFVGHRNALELYDVNVLGTTNLLEALSSADVKPRCVLLASSANIYGTPDVERIDERVVPAPVNHYAASKLAMEHMARTYAARLPLVITRPFNYTGAGQEAHFVVPKIVRSFRERQPTIELGNLDVERDFSDVRDVVAIYRRLLESPLAIGRTVNVASGRAIGLRAMIELLAQRTGHALEVRVNPAFVRPNEIPRLLGDTRLLDTLIGTMARTPFEDTLATMLAS